jgi:hypothetical protein
LLLKESFDYVLFLGNAWLLVDLLDLSLDPLLLFHDAGKPFKIPGYAISLAAAKKEICRWRDSRRGVRRTASYPPAGCQYQIEVSAWTLANK